MSITFAQHYIRAAVGKGNTLGKTATAGLRLFGPRLDLYILFHVGELPAFQDNTRELQFRC